MKRERENACENSCERMYVETCELFVPVGTIHNLIEKYFVISVELFELECEFDVFGKFDVLYDNYNYTFNTMDQDVNLFETFSLKLINYN